MRNKADVFLLFQSEPNENDKNIPKKYPCYDYNYKSLNTLGYNPIKKTIIPGSAHFPLLQFYKDYPQYQYYWNIEYDVIFTGKWNSFFKYYQNIQADFITSHVTRYYEDEDWYWWDTLKLIDIYIKKENFIMSFNPIYRISNRGLNLLNHTLADGNTGHHEVIIPTLFYHYNYKILDMKGEGEFREKNFAGSPLKIKSFISTDSMRFRPCIEEEEITQKNQLYHPVKF